jgi:hypothetical protein
MTIQNRIYRSMIQGLDEIHDMPDRLGPDGVPNSPSTPQTPKRIKEPGVPRPPISPLNNPTHPNAPPPPVIKPQLPLEQIIPFLQDLYDKMTSPYRFRNR